MQKLKLNTKNAVGDAGAWMKKGRPFAMSADQHSAFHRLSFLLLHFSFCILQ